MFPLIARAITVIVGVPTIIVLAYFFKFFFGYLHYRKQAIATGLPYVSVPYLDINFFFLNLVRTETYKKIVFDILPSSWTRWTRWVRPEFRWLGKYSIHADKGDMFQVVTPEQVIVNIADADVMMDILMRKNEFTKYQRALTPIKLLGENLLTTEGHDWSRHRKVVGPQLNEGTNQIVWKETIRQAIAMLQYWKQTPSAEHVFLLTTLNLLAVNVLSYVEFGVPLPFNHDLDVTAMQVEIQEKLINGDVAISPSELPPGHKMNFRTSINLIMGNFRKAITAIFIPRWVLHFLDKEYTVMYEAKHELDRYIQEIIHRERASPSITEAGKATLLSILVRSEAEERSADESAGLSMQEIIGNTYVLALASLDTTSGSLQFTLLNLAIHQDKQAWLHKQLDEDLLSAGMADDPSTWDYEQLFPKLTGPMCVIYESLRTHPSAPALLRTTGDSSRTLTMDGKTYVLPPDYVVALNFFGLHYNPKYWGANADKFIPERWAMNSEFNRNDPTVQPSIRFAGVRKPERGTFLPWSEGFRGCIGRRFAEVEMAAIVAVLFSRHRCEIRRLDGEDMAAATRRAIRALDESKMHMSFAVRTKIELVWYPRK